MKIYNVILSGGIGSRLWPLSRQKNPKQFLKLFAGKSLFELTAQRNEGLVDEVMVVGNQQHTETSKTLLENIHLAKHFIVETEARNTTAAIAFAALAAEPDDILIVTPSDHLIQNKEAYDTAIREAIHLAGSGFLVTFGVVPTKPETGFGYIEFEGNNVISFREKPNKETAEDFIKRGNFLWNSGMFCFKAGVLLDELKKYHPDVYAACFHAWKSSTGNILDAEASLQIPSVSIDYAVMERSDKIKVIPAAFSWNDLGSFESLYNYFRESGYAVDADGNMTLGTDLFTAFVGVKNCIFVQTEDVFLILQKEKSQDVKNVYGEIEKSYPALA